MGLMLMLMLKRRETDDEPGETSSAAPSIVKEGRKTSSDPPSGIRDFPPVFSNRLPDMAETRRKKFELMGKPLRWNAVLSDKHKAAVQSSIEVAFAEMDAKVAVWDARPPSKPGFDMTPMDEIHARAWIRSGNSGSPTREAAAGMATIWANVVRPHKGYETDDYYVVARPYRNIDGSEVAHDLFHLGYACRKTDGLLVAWTLPEPEMEEVFAARGIDLEVEIAERAAFREQQIGLARERARLAREKKNN